MIKVAIHGAAGRMGMRLIALTGEDKELELVATLEQAGHSSIGLDAGSLAGHGHTNVPISDTLSGNVDVLIDFSVPSATRAAVNRCVATGSSMVIGTTGLSDGDHGAIDEAAKSIAILQAPNMSVGVNLLFALAGQVARRLGDDYDVEIVETHHRFKKDAPSGTAVDIARAICEATGKDLDQTVVHGRHGDDVTRRRGQIGMHAVRSGDVVGRHTASFATLGEELQLTHIATSRDVFAHGALMATKWLAGKPAGRYRMWDALGL